VKKVMLVLFSFAELDKVINYTFDLLADDGKLEVVAFVEEEVPNSLSDLISNVGFLGEKVTKDVEDTIVDEYKDRAERHLKMIKERAADEDCRVEMKVYPKDNLEQVEKRLRSGEIDQAVINYTGDQFISEEVLVYPLDELLAEIDLPYEVYYDGELETDQTGEE